MIFITKILKQNKLILPPHQAELKITDKRQTDFWCTTVAKYLIYCQVYNNIP